MAIKSKSENYRDLVIDLTGPDGNAFALMGYARNLSNQLDLDFNKIQTEMTSGDYENLLEVFEENFGEFVTLYR